MSAPHLLAAAATLLDGLGPAVPAAAHVSAEPIAASAFTMSAGRLGSTVAAVIALAGVVIGALALARPARRTGIASGPREAVLALVSGLIGMALGGLVVANSDSGIGTGNGRGGGYVALAVGLIAVLLGGLALARSRRRTV